MDCFQMISQTLPSIFYWSDKPMTPPTITPLEQTDDPAHNYTIGQASFAVLCGWDAEFKGMYLDMVKCI